MVDEAVLSCPVLEREERRREKKKKKKKRWRDRHSEMTMTPRWWCGVEWL